MRDSATRKGQPIALGVVAYFGPALSAIDGSLNQRKITDSAEAQVTVDDVIQALDDRDSLVALAFFTLLWLETVLGGDPSRHPGSVFAMFPRSLAAIAEVSMRGNRKHNPGEPLHWAKEKSTDEADAFVRHVIDSFDAGPLELDDAGNPNLAAAAWRVLAWLTRVEENDDRWRNPPQ